MINLIPPAAKKSIIRDYWMRVVAVSLFALSAVLFALAALLVPAYVLVSSQLTSLEATAASRSADASAFKEVEAEVKAANAIARMLQNETTDIKSFELIKTFETIGPRSVTVKGVEITRNRTKFTELTVTGVAADRTALVAYRDAVLADERFITAELPISNFAENKDIPFSIDVEIVNPSE